MSAESKKRRRRARRAARWEFTTNELRMAGRAMDGHVDRLVMNTRRALAEKLDLAAMRELMASIPAPKLETAEERFAELAHRTRVVHADPETAAIAHNRLAEFGISVVASPLLERGALLAMDPKARLELPRLIPIRRGGRS